MVTIHEAIQSYLDTNLAMGKISPSTTQVRRYELMQFADFCKKHGVNDIRRVTKKHVREYIASRKISKSTVKHVIFCLNAFFVFCVDEGLVLENPAENISPPRTYSPEPDALDENELMRFYQALVEVSQASAVDRNLALAALISVLCLRVSEALNLKLSDLTLPRDPKTDAGSIRLYRKGGKDVRLPLSLDLYELLQRWLEHRPECQCDYVFVTRCGKRMSRTQAYAIISKALRHAGIVKRNMGPHLLRHTGASQLIANGTDIRTMQHLLGHASLVTTSRYVHLVGNMQNIRNAIENRTNAHPKSSRTHNKTE